MSEKNELTVTISRLLKRIKSAYAVWNDTSVKQLEQTLLEFIHKKIAMARIAGAADMRTRAVEALKAQGHEYATKHIEALPTFIEHKEPGQ